MIARASMIKATLAGRVTGDVWVIDTAHTAAAEAKYASVGAEVITIDPGIEVCTERAEARSPAALEQIRHWYGADQVGQTSEEW